MMRAGTSFAALGFLFSCQPEGPTGMRTPGEVSLAKGGSGGGGGGGGSGTAVTVTSTDPASAIQDTTISVSVFGTGFTNGAKAKWSLDGDTTQIIVKSTKVVNSGKLIAQIVVPATALVGSYDVIVTLSNGKNGVGAEMFTVETRPLYKMRLISGVNLSAGDGEITSDWFPETGFRVTANNPWAALPEGPVTIQLANFTHGDINAGTCAEFIANFKLPLNIIDWDVQADRSRSYAGTWRGNLVISRGYLAFDGDRVVNGVVTPGAGGIHNVVTQNNVMYESVGANNDWFRQEVRNAAFKLGGASTPDGNDLPYSELACVNYTVELRKTTLIP
jgi:hypothetical protein